MQPVPATTLLVLVVVKTLCKLNKAQAWSSTVGCGCGCVKCQSVNLKGFLSSISIRNKLENLISEKLV